MTSQTGHPPSVKLRDTDQTAASFTAPDVDSDTVLTFTLTVTDSSASPASIP